ncbi:MAG: S9 family peptidase [Steroidobacteraceae bacterium]
MSRWSFGAPPLGALLLVVSAAAAAAGVQATDFSPPKVPYVQERDGLTLEGVGPIDARLAARLAPYTEVRSARFLGWLPDGSMLVSTRFANTAQVHRVAAPLGMRAQLTYSPDPVTEAAAPQAAGAGFAFLADHAGDGNAQVYYYSLADHRVRQLTDSRSRHGALVWSKDGRYLAFYGNDRDGGSDDIYIVDPAAGTQPRLLVAGQQGAWFPLDWSPDGSTLLVQQFLSMEASRLYLADARTGALTPIPLSDGKHAGSGKVGIRSARFAPGGFGVYVVSDATGEFAKLQYIDLATHQPRDITASIPWDVDAFDVSPDGRYIAYVVDADGTSRLTVLDTRYKLEMSPPGLPQGVITNLGFDRTGRWLALTAESPQSPPDVYVYDVSLNKVVRWTRSELGPPATAAFVPAQLIRFPTWDRESLHRRMLSAYLYQPRTPGPYPVLIDIHDGPHGEARPAFDPFIQLVVNELGYAVVAPNIRGSAGYGKTFLTLDNGKLRGDAVRDIGSLLVWIDLQRGLDGKHVTVMGRGYGGWVALASMADYNDRLDGGIDFAGITDFVPYLENAPGFRQPALRAEYGDDREVDVRVFLDSLSPLDKERWIQRPLLVVQGLNDSSVPATQSQQLVATLRSRGDDVWYLGARSEGHVFRSMRDRAAYYRVAAAFLESLAH